MRPGPYRSAFATQSLSAGLCVMMLQSLTETKAPYALLASCYSTLLSSQVPVATVIRFNVSLLDNATGACTRHPAGSSGTPAPTKQS